MPELKSTQETNKALSYVEICLISNNGINASSKWQHESRRHVFTEQLFCSFVTCLFATNPAFNMCSLIYTKVFKASQEVLGAHF